MLKYGLSGRHIHTDALYGSMSDELSKHSPQPHALAGTAQKIIEEVATSLIEARMKTNQMTFLAAAGGVFANVSLNQKISSLPSVENFFVHPNMGDGGGAFGAAMLSLRQSVTTKVTKKIDDVYWGPSYSDGVISEEIEQMGLNPCRLMNIEEKIAELLIDGLVVGRFNGRMEYGPRALCNRSILVSATDADINDTLNARLRRTEFMPFAPVVLLEHGPELFVDFAKSINMTQFMTITLEVKERWRSKIPAVVHVDGTARPLWVSRESNPSAYAVLVNYYEKTGIPALINTSFNKHEEPIVCTPREAISSWQEGCVDALAMGPFLLK